MQNDDHPEYKYHEVIKSVIQKHGEKILDNPRMLESLLMDHFPQRRRETRLMILGLSINIVQEIKDIPDPIVPRVVVQRLAYKLYELYGIDAEFAYGVVEEWAWVFDKEADSPGDETTEEPEEEEEQTSAASLPPRLQPGRRPNYFAVIFITAFLTAAAFFMLFRDRILSGNDELPAAASVQTESAQSETPRPAVQTETSSTAAQTPSAASASPSKKELSGDELIKQKSRFVLKVRDAFTDEYHNVYIYASDEAGFIEPKNWKWGKKGDQIYKGNYHPYIEDENGSIRLEHIALSENRFNMNKENTHVSKKNDSVFALTTYDLGSYKKLRLYQLLDGKVNIIDSIYDVEFSEDLVPDDLMNK